MSEFKKHETTEECENAALDLFSKAVKSGKWMMAVWRVDSEDVIEFQKVTCSYPTGGFIQSMDMLREALVEEFNNSISIKPLPLAPHLLVRDENGEEKILEPIESPYEEIPIESIPANPDAIFIDEEITEKRKDDFSKGIFPRSLQKEEEQNENNN